MYMIGRVIIGFASMAVVVVSFVLCVELVSGKWRTIIGILNILPVAMYEKLQKFSFKSN